MRVLALSCLLVAVGVAGPSVASASPVQIGGFIGDRPGTHGGSFIQPMDVAFYEGRSAADWDDKVFVVEGSGASSRVQRLDADGNFERAWGRDVVRGGASRRTSTGYEICTRAYACKAGVTGSAGGELDRPPSIAVSPLDGSVYVLDGGNRRVSQYDIDGRVGRGWLLAPSRDGYRNASIAVAPTPPHDVFVADEPHDRVLQFDRDGGFVRGWGWGVGTGKGRFEVCAPRRACLTGRPVPARARRTPRWPSHIAVDRQGVVYAAAFLGDVFRGAQPRAWIARFRSSPAPPARPARRALLRPLTPLAGLPPTPANEATHLTNGATLGMDIEGGTSDLSIVNNPFGPTGLDVIGNAGAARVSNRRPASLPFLQNVTGLAVDGDVAYLSSGVIRQRTGTSSFTGCAAADALRDCHGLIVLAPGESVAVAAALPLIGLSSVTPRALIDAGGALRYQFQVSEDGRSWRDLGPPRFVIGSDYEVIASTGRLRGGALRRVRVVVARRTRHGERSTSISLGVTAGPTEGS